jgi:hypothetical protein
MDFVKSILSVLDNEWLLVGIYYLFIINVIGYIIFGNFFAIALLFIIGAITAQFSNKFSVILSVPTILVTFYVFGGNILFKLILSEGMDNMEEKDKDEKKEEENKDEKKDSDSSLAINPPLESSTDENVQSNEESFEVGRKKGGNYNVDYAATVEDAYDELNKIIDSDGIKKLTSDTQNLMNQQLKLAEAMKNMEPIINSMTPFIEKAEGFFGGFSKIKPNNKN